MIRYNELAGFLNAFAKTGYVNVPYILELMVKELGLDPTKALIKW